MNTSDELSFRGEPQALNDFIARLSSAKGEWRRDLTPDAIAARAKIPSPGARFVRVLTATTPLAQLNLAPTSGRQWTVGSVYPVGDAAGISFPPDEYHDVLVSFKEFAAPHAESTGVAVIGPGPRPIDLAEYTSGGAYFLAARFLAGADHRYPPTPADRQLWRAFAIRAFRDREPPPREVVSEWLVQRGWPSAAAEQLADEYVGTVRVLDEYEEAGRV